MTAVEWLYNEIKHIIPNDYVRKFEQAKEMEEKQSHEYAEFAIRCDRLDMKILNFDGYMNLQNTNK